MTNYLSMNTLHKNEAQSPCIQPQKSVFDIIRVLRQMVRMFENKFE